MADMRVLRIECLAALALVCALGARADGLKCGMEAAEKAAASTVPARTDGAVAKAFEELKEDLFDTPADRAKAVAVIRAALASPGDDAGTLREYLYQIASGIQSGPKGGWDAFELAPQPEEWLKSIAATKDTPKGVIESSWKYDENGKCVWTFAIPDGAKATVCVNGMCKRYKAGRYKLEIEKH